MYRMQFYQNLYLQVFCARSSGLLYIGKEKGGVCSEKEGLLSKGPRKVIVSFPQQPALLRLKQHISEKSRTTQSQVITEEEAFDQVKLLIPIIHHVFLFELVKITFR